MKEYCIALALSAFIRWLYGRIVTEWRKDKEDLLNRFKTLDDKFQEKTGIVFSPEQHERYDGVVTSVVSAIDNWINDGPAVRRFLRFVISLKDQDKRDAALAELESTDWLTKIEEVSPFLKEIINEWKQTEAEAAILAKASVALPPEFLNTRVVSEDVKNAVVANKVITNPVKSFRPPEIQAMIEKLRKKVDSQP